MKIEDVDFRIKQLQGVIIEATAKLEAWSEVRSTLEEESSEGAPTRRGVISLVSPKKSSKYSGITDQIYSVFPDLPVKFTSTDVVKLMKDRFGDEVDSRSLSTSVCSLLHSTVKGKLKSPRYVVKACGKRDGLKLYTRQ